MKINVSGIKKIFCGKSGKLTYIKTKPYPSDSVNLSCGLKPQKTFMQKVREFLGLRTKLKPNYFADGSHTPKGPFVASAESVAVSDKFIKKGYLSENDRIVEGFRDGGRNAVFTKFGDTVYADREIITIDRLKDVYLNNIINYTHRYADNLSEKKKVKFIYNLVRSIEGDKINAKNMSDKIGQTMQGKEILLGKVFEHEGAVCRHKSILVKILGDELGLKTRIIKGNMKDIIGEGAHVWNEIKLSNGKKLLLDTQQDVLLDISGKNASNNYILSQYYSLNNHLVYK